MEMGRRKFVIGVAGAAALPAVAATAFGQGGADMYGLIGKMTAVAGKRDELLAILTESVGEMPGCLSYIIAKDATDSDAIWITEAWDSKASHDASLSLPQVRQAIARAKPLIAGFGSGVVTTPVGGHGLTSPKR